MSAQQSKSAVVYLRVSTTRQGQSGLGLEAQRSAVQGHTSANGMVVVAEFVEVESGKRDDRPQLAAALAACRLHCATLVIAKLDRLARNVHFISGLMAGGAVPFVAVDSPFANRLTLHILAAIAEHEAAAISERTKAALAAAKARGAKLGNPHGAAHLRAGCREAASASAARRRSMAEMRAAAIAPLLADLRERGISAPRALALELNRLKVPAPSGGCWYTQQVRKALVAAQSVGIASN